MEKIKVLIADDNQVLNEIMIKNLEKYDEIEILGSCTSDIDEMFMIDNLKPEIVITDIIRNNGDSGLEVIKKYKGKSNLPKFLVITGGENELIDTKLMDGFINKPFLNYDVILKRLRLIKSQIEIEK